MLLLMLLGLRSGTLSFVVRWCARGAHQRTTAYGKYHAAAGYRGAGVSPTLFSRARLAKGC